MTTLASHFLKLAKVALCRFTTEIKTRTHPCPDQYVGAIVGLCGLTKKQFDKQRYPVIERPRKPCLILVIESPHSEEYKESKPLPANGTTGRNIRKYLHMIEGLESFFDSEHGLILVNAIQYQCSLGVSTDTFRDQIFEEMWINCGAKEDFITRLRAVYEVGDTVVNACTKGYTKPYLRDLVEDAIRDAHSQDQLDKFQLLCCSHPSSWNLNKNNRKLRQCSS